MSAGGWRVVGGAGRRERVISVSGQIAELMLCGPGYGKMAAYYDVGVLPARPRKPRDKAKVEAGVRFSQSYILGRLRHQTFFSLEEANASIAQVMAAMNGRPMRRLGVSRSDLLESLERPALSALPQTDYEYAEWRLARVGLDYHVEIETFFYSVPHALIREQVDVRVRAALFS